MGFFDISDESSGEEVEVSVSAVPFLSENSAADRAGKTASEKPAARGRGWAQRHLLTVGSNLLLVMQSGDNSLSWRKSVYYQKVIKAPVITTVLVTLLFK